MSTKIQFSPSWKLWQFCAATVFATGTIVVAPIAAQAFSFTPLQGIDGRLLSITPKDVSADGSTVIGQTLNNNRQMEMFRWRPDTGMQLFSYNLPILVPAGYEVSGRNVSTFASAVSGDGSVIAGYVAAYAGNQTSQQAFRWTENTGFTLLDHVPINPQYRSRVSQSISGGISADGTRIVGYSGSAWSQPDPATEWRNVLQEQTVYWNGTALPIVLPNQEARNRNLTAISGNGQTLVGQVDGEAGIWNSTNGYTRLGDFAGGTFDSAATAASADGSVVVGYRTGPTTVQAFRWTAAGGMVGLTNPQDGNNFSLAQDVAADGAMIVGKNHIGAFMWTPETGMQSVQEVLIAAGVPMDGWTLNSAIAVSADGSTIVGTGTHASNPYGDLGWIARIRGTGTGTVNPNNPVDEVPTGSGGSNNPPTGSGNSNGTPEGEGSGGDVMPVGTGGGGAGGGGTGVNQGGNGSIPGTANGNTDAIPTPAMLPALLGFGARLWRKQQVAKAH